ncbi:hypothetical protein [Candidatus Blastococcus massiliensis]|uniref:hypothetical protein n=1 Tax=Candidatus Blastococcus massiliensis TaxID=1470358 RepID=UPI0004B34648|nr:hypothetical protein [Candidatus Blastococcus massiliensis]
MLSERHSIQFERVGSPTVRGRPAELVSSRDDAWVVGPPPYWALAWDSDDTVVCQLQAVKDFGPEDVVALAEGVTYTP